MSVALIVAIVGALAYVLLNRTERTADFAELGRLAFLAGMIGFLINLAR